MLFDSEQQELRVTRIRGYTITIDHNNLSLLGLSQSSDSTPDAGGGCGAVVPGSSGNSDTTILIITEPDSNSLKNYLIRTTIIASMIFFFITHAHVNPLIGFKFSRQHHIFSYMDRRKCTVG